jgi:hypothetical protein
LGEVVFELKKFQPVARTEGVSSGCQSIDATVSCFRSSCSVFPVPASWGRLGFSSSAVHIDSQPISQCACWLQLPLRCVAAVQIVEMCLKAAVEKALSSLTLLSRFFAIYFLRISVISTRPFLIHPLPTPLTDSFAAGNHVLLTNLWRIGMPVQVRF